MNYKNLTKCTSCSGAGALYQNTGKTAGLKLNPADPSYASINGFKTDKYTIKILISQAKIKGNDIAVEFLEKLSRLNAVRLDTEFKAEQIALEKRLNEIVEDVMGDTPINLNSGIDRTKVVYSRTVIDREAHKRQHLGPTGETLYEHPE